VYGVVCEGILADGEKELDTSGLHGQRKIISDGKIIAVAADKTRTHGC
jgi:hypothetical protein